MNTEQRFIGLFGNKATIGDDAAYIDGFTYSADNFFENVHFRREWMSMEQIASKAMLVNISDAVAMNAKPLYALICIGLPRNLCEKDLVALSRGFKKEAKRFGVQIVGGDTIENEKLDISITIIGKTQQPLFRKGLKNGDLLAFTGTLGGVKRDLQALQSGGTISRQSRFLRPKLREKFVYRASSLLSCGLDISDGLFFEMQRLSEVNSMGFSMLKEIPNGVGCSGEEYEMLVGFSPQNYEEVAKIAAECKTKLTVFAKSVNGRFVCPCRPHHFE